MNLRKTLSFSYTGKSSRNGSLLCHEMISGWKLKHVLSSDYV